MLSHAASNCLSLPHKYVDNVYCNRCLLFQLQISFLKDCLQQYQLKCVADSNKVTKKRAAHKSGPTFRQLFHCTLLDDFTATPRDVPDSVEDESSLNADFQGLHYDDFCLSFQKLLDLRYSHLDELHLFGDLTESCESDSTDKQYHKGIVTTDFDTDLKACTELQEYKQFFLQKFSQYVEVTELNGYFEKWYNACATNFCSSDEFYQGIINQVSFFCYYLIDTRVHVVESFEEFEQDIHCELCSYPNFKRIIDSQLQNKLSDIATMFKGRVENLRLASSLHTSMSENNARTNTHVLLIMIENLVGIHQACSIDITPEDKKMRESILKVEIDLYKEILKTVDNNSKINEQIKQYLSSSINHFAYFHRHLSNIGKLLSIMVNPYQVHVMTNDGRSVYTLAMTVGSISGALSAFSEWLQCEHCKYSLTEGDELRLCAESVLYLDSDVYHDSLTCQGVSIVLISPKLSHEEHDKVSINTDGKSLGTVLQTDAASSGRDGNEHEQDGRPGKDGENGCYGNAGGHILIVSSNLCWNNFALSAKGSPGQNGQDGGNGGDGWSPSDQLEGQDGVEPTFKSGYAHDSVVISYGTNGHSGGQGGDAGMGGAPGKAGISGKIELIDLQNEVNCKTSQEEIEDGEPGKAGKPGKGGKHTRHGKDWGKYGEYTWFLRRFSITLLDWKRPDYSISSIKGELEHPAIKPRPGSGKQYEEKGKGLPKLLKREDHPDFNDRGYNRDGKAADVKVNSVVANENNAIDKNACLMAISNLCTQTKNHWNERSQLHFLKLFASKIGESYLGGYVTPTHSERIRAGQAVWIDRILNLSGKTVVAVTHTEQHTQKASVQLMADFEGKHESNSLNYLSCKRDTDVEADYIDLSPFKERARQKGIMCRDSLPLKSILVSDEFDDYFKVLTSEIGFSAESSIYIVAVDDTEKAQELAQKYDFLTVYNRSEECWYMYHTQGRQCFDIDKELMESHDLLLEGNEPLLVDQETDEYLFQDIVHCLIVTEVSVVLPCTTDQLRCILQHKLIVCIRQSYKGLYRLCDETNVHQLQCTYTEFLIQLLDTSSSLDSIRSLQEELEHSYPIFLLPINITWLEENETCSNLAGIEQLKKAVMLYNKDYSLKRMLTVYYVCELSLPMLSTC